MKPLNTWNTFEHLLYFRVRVDWNFLWAGLHHAGPNHNAKIILKEEVRRIPGIGWVLAMSRNIFLQRSWAKDVGVIDSMLDYFQSIKVGNMIFVGCRL